MDSATVALSKIDFWRLFARIPERFGTDHKSILVSKQVSQEIHHHVIYDLRTLLGTKHANFLQIGLADGSPLSLILQHPFSTSITVLFEKEIAQIMDTVNQFNSHERNIQVFEWRPNDPQVLVDLHEMEFMADIVFIDVDHEMDKISTAFYNVHDFVELGGFLVIDDYEGEQKTVGDVPAFIDEIVSNIVIHNWQYFDPRGSFPACPTDYEGKKLFIFQRRSEERLVNPFVSPFSSKFYGRQHDLEMGLSRASSPRDRPFADEGMHFAVVMSFFKRDFDPHFVIPLETSLSSLARQTHTAWTLVAVGDGLAPADADALLRAVALAGIPPERLRFANMDARFREERIYRNRDAKFDWDYSRPAGAPPPPPPRLGVWKCAGTNALNVGLDMAEGVAAATHVARLDEDDVWLPHHLANLAAGYRWARPHIGRDADLVYTQGRDIGGQHFFPSFNRSTCVRAQRPYRASHSLRWSRCLRRDSVRCRP